MSFLRGIFSATDVQVAPCGILSVVRETRHTRRARDEQWIRGYVYELPSAPDSIDLVAVNNNTIDDGNMYDGTGRDTDMIGSPFFIEISDSSTGVLIKRDWKDSLLEQLDTVTQKALERELWDGPVADDANNSTPHLARADGAEVLTTTAVDAARALQLLEQAIAEHPLGARGTIHMTRDVASALGSRLLYKNSGDGRDFPYAITRLGTDIIIGSGYSGNGPKDADDAEATSENRWMYATGAVDVHLGKAEMITEDIAQGFNSGTNNATMRASRPAAVHFDPSVWVAAQVTLA